MPAVPLARFLPGNEIAVVVQNEFGKFEGRTLAFDSVPGCLTTPLYHAGWTELDRLSTGGGSTRLDCSRRMRLVLQAQLKLIPSDRPEWRRTVRSIASCWRVLEMQLLEQGEDTAASSLVVDWANELHYDDEENEDEEDAFPAGLALLLRGRGREAGERFRELIPTAGPRLQRFFEVLSAISYALPTASSSSASAWQKWQHSLAQLDECVPREDKALVQVCHMLRGDVSALVRHFQQAGGGGWPQLLAAVLLFKAPLATKSVLGELADRCAEPFIKRGEFDAARLAFRGDAARAIERLHDLDAWSECHMGLVFLQDDDYAQLRQTLCIKFACQVGLGPGRVPSRPVCADLASLRLSLDYLRYAQAPQQYFDAVLSTVDVAGGAGGGGERYARQVIDVVRAHHHLPRMRRDVVRKWIRVGALQHALQWAEGERELELLVLARLTSGSFAGVEPQPVEAEYTTAAGQLSDVASAVLRLVQVRYLMSSSCDGGEDGKQRAVGLLLDVVEDGVCGDGVLLLHAVLVGERLGMWASAAQCLHIVRLANSQASSSLHSAELLVMATARLAELAKRNQ